MSAPLHPRGSWIVSFLLEEWDELREFQVTAESEAEAITKAEREHLPEATDPTPAEQIEDELADFDPTQEGGGQPCERCGGWQEPWRYSRLCQGCIWDDDERDGHA